MQVNPKPRDFISRAGTAMTFIAWIIFLLILMSVFDYLIEQRNNPNQNLVTTVSGPVKEIKLQRNPYGHYVATGTINDSAVTFLLDTGASDIAIPESLADDVRQRGCIGSARR